MPLGFTFTGDSLSPSASGPALGGATGISIQGITTGGSSDATTPVGGTSAPGLGQDPNMELIVLIAIVAILVLHRD